MLSEVVAEDRCKRSHRQENTENSVTYVGSGIVAVVHFLVEIPFSRDVQVRMTRAFARSLAWAHNEGRETVGRRRLKSRHRTAKPA
jgi:hypothetical protein